MSGRSHTIILRLSPNQPISTMSEYRRDNTPGATWFFTVVTWKRQRLLEQLPIRQALRRAITLTRHNYPFAIDACVLLPDHLHCIWTLPTGDADYSIRWSMIKRLTSQRVRRFLAGDPHMTRSQCSRRELALWQRRYWEHRIRNVKEFRQYVDYIHWNPVKHGMVKHVADWPWSTFHRFVQQGCYPFDWGERYRPTRQNRSGRIGAHGAPYDFTD